MVLDWLGQGFVALTLLGCAAGAVVILAQLYLLARYLALRPGALALEARRLAFPLPADDALPHVVVQIPVYNEGVIVERAVASAAQLDWPRGRLHIQVCDDSTDETTALAHAAAERACADGIDVVVLRRPDRSGFKAGNLKNAMAQTIHDYFVIFDVDFVPPRDFLRRCMKVMLAEPDLGFVQARIDFLNSGESALTRAQTIVLDYHYGFEQATRSWANQLLPFNGACGIWRRAAIEAAGGWDGDTLLEDWDLSYRAWMRGWRGTFVMSVTARCELPVDPGAWMAQQRRWASGSGEVALKMLPTFGGIRNLSQREYWAALTPLGMMLAYSVFPATIIAAIAALLLRPSMGLVLGLALYVLFVSSAVVFSTIAFIVNRTVRRNTPFLRFVLDQPIVWMLTSYIAWANLRCLPGTLLRRRRTFVRTPKRGSIPDLP